MGWLGHLAYRRKNPYLQSGNLSQIHLEILNYPFIIVKVNCLLEHISIFISTTVTNKNQTTNKLLLCFNPIHFENISLHFPVSSTITYEMGTQLATSGSWYELFIICVFNRLSFLNKRIYFQSFKDNDIRSYIFHNAFILLINLILISHPFYQTYRMICWVLFDSLWISPDKPVPRFS